MKALILNSGTGSRMGDLTKSHPKCMTELASGETIISRQLSLLAEAGVKDVVITTGYFDKVLIDYCNSLGLNLNIGFVNNDLYDKTNYIYSIYLAREFLGDDIVMMHGDLIFSQDVLSEVLSSKSSCVTVSSTKPLPEKDFKAVVESGKVAKIGIEFFDNAFSCQPLYKLVKKDWLRWLGNIEKFCECGDVNCYAEKALNEVAKECKILPLDTKEALCMEVDNADDLKEVNKIMKEKKVYMCFSSDIIHAGHIAIIEKASKLGKLTIGALTDEAIASFKRFPILEYCDRFIMYSNLKNVENVVAQNTLSYKENILEIKPDIVVHGDNWNEGFQKPIREEVIELLNSYGGELVEYKYSEKENLEMLEKQARNQLSTSDVRRGRLKKLLNMKKTVSVIEAHSGITGLIAENTVIYQEGKGNQFDGMWVSSLCDSTAKGKPDIELVDMTSRLRTIDDIMEVTTKPIILDGDTGGLTEHFVYNVKTLERIGVSAVIIEDKTGLKKNSLFGTEVEQTQDDIPNFCAKIKAGKQAQKTDDFMIIARIESLILEQGMDDALERAFAYVDAGADGIMIHSRKKSPAEIFEFVEKFRSKEKFTPIVVVPTSFNEVTEDEFAKRGVNIVIYANQLTRSGFPAMQDVAKTILTNHRAKEADDKCMSIKEILNLIPEDN